MKTNHNCDPLDQQIDTLLASRPVKPSDDFAARVLAAADTAVSEDSSGKWRPVSYTHLTLPTTPYV